MNTHTIIRGKKTENANCRVFYENGLELGFVRLSFKNPNSSYVGIGKFQYKITYRLKKRAFYYNRSYLARIMRKLFMIEYTHYEADVKKSDARVEQSMRVMKMTDHLKQYRQDMVVQKQRERIAARNAYNMEIHLDRLEQGFASEFHQEMGF